MDTMLIQLTSQKAVNLIKNLEDLKIIKVLSQNFSGEKLSDKFRGSLNLTEKEYDDIQQQLTDLRNEWKKNT